MKKNLNLTNGLFFSQRVMLELTNAGLKREKAYSLVQRKALEAWRKNASFYDYLVKDSKIIKKIPVNKLKKLFDFSYHTKKIDIIFKRGLKKN